MDINLVKLKILRLHKGGHELFHEIISASGLVITTYKIGCIAVCSSVDFNTDVPQEVIDAESTYLLASTKESIFSYSQDITKVEYEELVHVLNQVKGEQDLIKGVEERIKLLEEGRKFEEYLKS